MIEINLLSGAGRKSRGRGTSSSFNFGATLAAIGARVKDPWLITAVVSVVLAVAAVGVMFLRGGIRQKSLVQQEQKAVQDSTRYAAVLREKHKAEAQRDSVLQQLGVIRAIDNDRFVWPHILDEVSRALPPYTWLTSVAYVPAAPPAGPAPAPAAGDKSKAPKKTPLVVPVDTVHFRVVGNTVDIQALTRFMKLLEASPFVQNVQLTKSEMIIEQGKEVTEFQLEAEYQHPDPAAIRTQSIALSVR